MKTSVSPGCTCLENVVSQIPRELGKESSRALTLYIRDLEHVLLRALAGGIPWEKDQGPETIHRPAFLSLTSLTWALHPHLSPLVLETIEPHVQPQLHYLSPVPAVETTLPIRGPC